MPTRFSFPSQRRHSGVDLFRMWKRGWKVIWKTLQAFLILSAGRMLWGFVGQFVQLVPENTDWGHTLRLLSALVTVLVIMPLGFYVAASWVGFCPYVDCDEDDPA